MKIQNIIFLICFVIAGFVVSSSALASELVNLAENGDLKVETVDLKNKYISNVKVYQEDHMLVIFGKVNRRHKTLPGRGHVDIVLTGPDGNVITKAFLPYTSSKKFKNRTWNFHAKIHVAPPKGSTMHVTVGG